ncbi:MAG: hypothetical protein J0L53_02820 [Spirochaetes bacterium]|nr:hypothetical protein [Spirochaetota bacterium]
MQVRVKFSQFDGYWVAESENGAISQGETLDECRDNIRAAIRDLAEFEEKEHPVLSEKVEVLEVAI